MPRQRAGDAGAARSARRPREESAGRLERLAKVSKSFTKWRPSKEILTRVRAHRTIFPQLDRATRLGGIPLERVLAIHGPTNHGKTSLMHGIGLSFLRAGNFYAFIDAERTTSEQWLNELMGGQNENPGFVAMRPDSYEEAVEGVREFVTTVLESKKAGDLDDDVTGFVVVDSVRKLTPQRLVDKILKGEGGVDGANNMGAMMKAAANSAWMDELVPLMHHAGFTIALILRESQNTAKSSPWDVDYKVQGGNGVQYESSLTCRVTRAAWVSEGEGERRRILGERHSVRITKTKVGGKDGKDSVAYFHTSNGALTPVGFDRARDVLDLGLRLGVLEKKGNAVHHGKDRLGASENKAVKFLADEPDVLDDVAAKLMLGEGEELSESEEVDEGAPIAGAAKK